MFKNNPQFFIIFCNLHILLQLLCLAENTTKNVLRKTQFKLFSKTQLLKPLFSPKPKNTFSKQRRHFRFGAISAETTISVIFPGFSLFWAKIWAKQIVCTKVYYFALPDTNGVRRFLLKILFVIFLIFGYPP